MNEAQILRAAFRPLRHQLVQPLEREDLYQVARIALWQAGNKPPDYQTVIARSAMQDELRRHRWIGRGKNSPMQEMVSYDSFAAQPGGSASEPDASDSGLPEDFFGTTDCLAASMVAVRQCIAGFGRLTERQRDVLGALASGMHQAEVARTLGISEKRVSQLVGDLRAVIARYV
jgi:RNA polymerase sigma factor (sigma-70 family)